MAAELAAKRKADAGASADVARPEDMQVESDGQKPAPSAALTLGKDDTSKRLKPLLAESDDGKFFVALMGQLEQKASKPWADAAAFEAVVWPEEAKALFPRLTKMVNDTLVRQFRIDAVSGTRFGGNQLSGDIESSIVALLRQRPNDSDVRAARTLIEITTGMTNPHLITDESPLQGAVWARNYYATRFWVVQTQCSEEAAQATYRRRSDDATIVARLSPLCSSKPELIKDLLKTLKRVINIFVDERIASDNKEIEALAKSVLLPVVNLVERLAPQKQVATLTVAGQARKKKAGAKFAPRKEELAMQSMPDKPRIDVKRAPLVGEEIALVKRLNDAVSKNVRKALNLPDLEIADPRRCHELIGRMYSDMTADFVALRRIIAARKKSIRAQVQVDNPDRKVEEKVSMAEWNAALDKVSGRFGTSLSKGLTSTFMKWFGRN